MIGSSAGDIGLRVVGPVLELDVHAGAELFEIESTPVDPDRFGRHAAPPPNSCAVFGHLFERLEDFARTRLAIWRICATAPRG
jgi:hypothetical protein